MNRITFGCGAALLMSALSVAACGSNPAPTAPTAAASARAATGPTPATVTTTPPPQTTTAPADSSAVSPCALVTEGDATALLGSDPGAGVLMSRGPVSSCGYQDFHVGLQRGAGVTGLFAAMQSADQNQPGFQAVNSVGDAGFLLMIPGADSMIYILQGTSLMSMLAPQGPRVTAATLTALGTTAAGRL
jgi:hypothetical protein